MTNEKIYKIDIMPQYAMLGDCSTNDVVRIFIEKGVSIEQAQKISDDLDCAVEEAFDIAEETESDFCIDTIVEEYFKKIGVEFTYRTADYIIYY